MHPYSVHQLMTPYETFDLEQATTSHNHLGSKTQLGNNSLLILVASIQSLAR